MDKRFRMLLVLPVLLALGACLAPTDPGLPHDGDDTEPSEPGDGQSFNTVPAPVIFV